jgi:hypothetical protein
MAHLLPAFAPMAVEEVTAEPIERWMAGFEGSVRTRNKLLIQLHGILRRARKVGDEAQRLVTAVGRLVLDATAEGGLWSPPSVARCCRYV